MSNNKDGVKDVRLVDPIFRENNSLLSTDAAGSYFLDKKASMKEILLSRLNQQTFGKAVSPNYKCSNLCSKSATLTGICKLLCSEFANTGPSTKGPIKVIGLSQKLINGPFPSNSWHLKLTYNIDKRLVILDMFQ